MDTHTEKLKKRCKYTFTLHNIDINYLREKYNVKIPIQVVGKQTTKKHRKRRLPKVTQISELNGDTSNRVSFLDETKQSRSGIISNIQYNTHQNINNDIDKKFCCYWCRNTFDTIPIGCPLRYISNKTTNVYSSQTSDYIITVSENVSKTRLNGYNKHVKKENTTRSDQKEYYETDGVFCSYNCCKAFIDDNKGTYLYHQSNMLLLKMYNDTMDTNMQTISPSPHWRLLKEYGGHMTITEYRNSFNKMEYDEKCKVHHTDSLFHPVGTLFEENLKF